MNGWTSLARAHQWRRLPDGSTEVRLRDGRSLRCGRGAAPMLDALADGVAEAELARIFLCEPQCNALWLTLTELQLVEQGAVRRGAAVPLLAAPAQSERATGTRLRAWPVLLLGLQLGNLAAGLWLLPSVALAGAGVGPVWLFLVLAVFVIHAGLHELAHQAMAAAYGVVGRIRLFHQGFWQPRFEAKPQAGLSRPAAVGAIYAAGPLLDLSLQGLALACLLYAEPKALAAAAWCVASGLVVLNLAPSGQSDGNKLLSLLGLTLAWRRAYALVCLGSALVALVLGLRLSGAMLAGGF